MFPLDAVKTELMAESSKRRGIANALISNYRAKGFLGTYNGLISLLIGITPEKAIKLAANEFFRFYMPKNEKGEVSIPYGMLAGGGAGLCQVVVTNPMEITKIRMQLAPHKTMVEVVRGLGVRGLYHGTVSTWLRDIPFSMVFFPLYAMLRDYFKDANGETRKMYLLLSGSAAGFVASGLVTPMDVVKTRVQMEGSPYKGIVDCFTRVYKEEGSRALWRGLTARMLLIAPLFGITLTVFDALETWAKKHWD